MAFIFNSWNGKEALWRVWLIGYPLTWIFLFLGMISFQKLDIAIAPAIIPGIFLYVWLLVSVWRCSKNSKFKFWFYANRGLVLLTCVAGVLMLVLKN